MYSVTFSIVLNNSVPNGVESAHMGSTSNYSSASLRAVSLSQSLQQCSVSFTSSPLLRILSLLIILYSCSVVIFPSFPLCSVPLFLFLFFKLFFSVCFFFFDLVTFLFPSFSFYLSRQISCSLPSAAVRPSMGVGVAFPSSLSPVTTGADGVCTVEVGSLTPSKDYIVSLKAVNIAG